MKNFPLKALASALSIALLLMVSGLQCPRRGEAPGREVGREPVVGLKTAEGIKRLKMEEYVAGVVAGEMKRGWPLEAYKAQAIVARSYALNSLTAGGTRPLGERALEPEHEEAQAYRPDQITPEIRRAVQETRGLVMEYRGVPIKAYFHSASGGYTAKASDAGLVPEGKEPPYIKQVRSPEDRYAPPEVKSWEATFTSAEVLRALREKLGQPVKGGLRDIVISRKDTFGRAVDLTVLHGGGSVTVKANDLRTALDPERMRSTVLHRIEVKGERVTVAGKGFGHGVGLSQWGAYAMAKEGRKAEEILQHYFPTVEIKRLWR